LSAVSGEALVTKSYLSNSKSSETFDREILRAINVTKALEDPSTRGYPRCKKFWQNYIFTRVLLGGKCDLTDAIRQTAERIALRVSVDQKAKIDIIQQLCKATVDSNEYSFIKAILRCGICPSSHEWSSALAQCQKTKETQLIQLTANIHLGFHDLALGDLAVIGFSDKATYFGSPFMTALRKHNLPLIKALIRSWHISTAKTIHYNYPSEVFVTAAKYGPVDVLEAILDTAVAENLTPDNWRDAFMQAALHNQRNILHFLDAQAVNRRAIEGLSVVKAERARNINDIQYAWAIVLICAVERGYHDLARDALSRGAPANTYKRPRMASITSIHLATWRADEEMIELLLENGAILRSFSWACPLQDAVSEGLTSIIQLFVKHGAKPNGGRSDALIHAIEKSQKKSVELLLELGLHKNMTDEKLRDAHLAATALEDHDILKTLARHGIH
jgi:hypothetical protein